MVVKVVDKNKEKIEKILAAVNGRAWRRVLNYESLLDVVKTAQGRLEGIYTGRDGEEGELVLFQPDIDQVYAYGQKDRRGNNTLIKYVKWDGNKFLVCNKPGKVKETNTSDKNVVANEKAL